MRDIPTGAPPEPAPAPRGDEPEPTVTPLSQNPLPTAEAHEPYVPYEPPTVPTNPTGPTNPSPASPGGTDGSANFGSFPPSGGLPLSDNQTWANWVPADEFPPSPPQYGTGYGPYPVPPRQPRPRGWITALVVLALLAMLGVGFGAGALVEAGRTGTTNSGGGTPVRQVTIGSSAAPVSDTSGATALQQTVEQVVQGVQPSVVEVTSTSNRQEAIGSGDILSTDGYIVTNDHVVNGFNSYTVTLSSGKTLPAQLVGEDAQDDLAVLKVSASNLKPIAIADSANVKVGQFALAVGNPLGLQQSATFGIVSALNRTASEAPDGPAGELTGLIQTSAPINPGNSGGALVDLQGRLIGIPTLGATDTQTGGTADGIGFAIPSDRVQFVATQLIQHGQLVSTGQGFLGIQSEDVTPQIAAADGLSTQSGVLVVGFFNDAAGTSPAQQAGLHAGDIIVAVNGKQISDGDDLASALLSQQPGTRVSLTIVRGSQQQTVSVTLGERPTNTQG